MNESYIKLLRKLTEWEWYKDSQMVHLFIHLLLKANFSDGNFQGKKVMRGQLITGTNSLAESTGIARQSVRTCLNKLKLTNEITIESTNKNSLITIVKYNDYQSFENKPTSKTTNKITIKQPTTNQQLTTIEEGNKEEEINIEFSVFWNLYNKKEGDKPLCEKKWLSLKNEERQKIINTLPIFLSKIKEKQYQPLPATYLNQKRWNDEIATTITHNYTDIQIREAKAFKAAGWGLPEWFDKQYESLLG